MLGEHRRREREGDNKYRWTDEEVASIVVYPEYIPQARDHDIALVKLSRPVRLSPGIQPACAPNATASYAHARGLVSGWGDTFYGTF